MTTRQLRSIAIAIACLVWGCPSSKNKDSEVTGGSGAGGSSTSSSSGGSHADHAAGTQASGTGGGHESSTGGNSSSSTQCPPNTPIPALCRMCSGGSCGVATCDGTKFIGFVCPGDAGSGAQNGGTSGGHASAGHSASGGSTG